MHFELIDFAISFCLLLGAILYTSVGHAGASIYIAIMTLFNIPSSVIKPTALVLNIFIASFTSWRFIRKGFFDLKVLLPIALGALSPLILFLGWSSTKTTSGITALFILINSSFGLLGNYSSVQNLPSQLPLFIGAALIGALIGTTLGIKFYTANTIKKKLALVLVIAGFKLLLT